MSALISLLLAVTFAQSQDLEPQGREMGLKEVLIPVPRSSSHEFRWQYFAPLGNADGDQYSDFVVSGISVPPLGSSDPYRWSVNLASNPSTRHVSNEGSDELNQIEFFTGGRMTGGLLNVPVGFPWVLGSKAGSTSGQVITARNPNNHSEFWTVPVPPHPTLPNAFGVAEVFPGGDLNQDGWDEAFYLTVAGNAQATYFVCGAIDGQTQASLWQVYLDDFLTTPEGLPRVFEGSGPDLNLDGTRDFLIGYQLKDLSFRYAALSGIDGSIIWERLDNPGFHLSYRGGVANQDLNFDGIPDLVTTFRGIPNFGNPHPGWTTAIDGANGATIWKTTHDGVLEKLEQEYGPGYLLYFRETVLGVTPSNTPGSSLEVWIAVQMAQAPNFARDLFVCFDALTGELNGFQNMPKDLLPWSPTPMQDNYFHLNFENLFAAGDIDGDGHFEFVKVTATDGPLPNTWHSYLSIFGHTSLFVPETIDLGGMYKFSLFIPSQPNGAWKLLGSRRFDPIGGQVVRGWRTHLVDDSFYRSTLAFGPSGTLDAEGRITAEIAFPNNPALQGATLYSRAMIMDSLQPNQIATMSTVGVTVVN
ncbi:MAG: hypothetical protein H8E15_10315 [Planctomycetes bacterium]|nr:hypothetical protein [Planctomycetota bacterium]